VRSKSPQQADKILAAAAQLFATHRFHEARMEDIAALAEVGKGTLYRYFKDKEELFLALLEQAAAGMEETLARATENEASPREQLVVVVAAILDYFESHPHLFDLIQHAEVMQRAGQAFPWQKVRNQTLGRVKEIFQAGQHEGTFAIDDPDLAALMLLGGLRGVLRFTPRPLPTNLPERIVAGFLGGYGDSRRTRPRGAAPSLSADLGSLTARVEP
jgi:TetR/AcrR family fatty acid metabolism transcriptional regulator